MIRIDEIYNNTFWPWVRYHLPLTRMFFLDPFGSTDPADLKNFGLDTTEYNYIFMHDQEPIDLKIHRPLFDEVSFRNIDLIHGKSAIIVSEIDSANLTEVCDKYNWRSFYYFFHGWASLDWYRGYDKTFLMPDPAARQIVYSFLSPNRIIGGQRDHRVLLIYHLLKKDTKSALISCPSICPQENQSIIDIASKYQSIYPDIISRLDQAGLPWHFDGEQTHPMHSCWLSLFDQAAQSMAYVVTETVFFDRRLHLTEKTFKPICLQMPFVLASSQGSLKYLRSYGFKTFGDYWDESYDDESDDLKRLEKIADVLADIDAMPDTQRQSLYRAMLPVLRHNYDHFYKGGFESILWQEFRTMLTDMKTFFHLK